MTRPRRARPPAHAGIGCALAAAFAAAYALLAWARYRGFVWSSWDLAIFTEVVRHYGHLQTPVAEVKGPGFDFLGDHFSPILAVLGPVYRLLPTPVTLLVAQALLLGWSVAPVTGAAVRRLGARSGTAVGVAYGLSFGLVQAVQVDFHEVGFAVPLVAYAAVALLEDRWRAAVAWSLPLILVKEDLGATVAVVGVLIALGRGPERAARRRAGVLLAGFGLAASAIEVLVLIPHAAGGAGYAYFSHYGEAGSGWGERAQTAWRLVLLTAGVALRSRLVLLALPTLCWRFASDNPAYWGTDWHYDAVLMPVLFVALVDGVGRLAASPRRPLRWYARAAVPATVVVALAALPSSPLRQLTSTALWTDTPQRAALRQALTLVPAGASVQSDLGLISHLAGRNPVAWIGVAGPAPDYVVIDAATGWNPPEPAALPAYLDGGHPGSQYRLLWTGEGVSVLRRDGAR